MEDFIVRFPYLFEDICKKLDNISLVNSRGVSRTWQIFINNQRQLWIKIIQTSIGTINEDWKKVIQKTPKEMLMKLACEVKKICEIKSMEKYSIKSNPLHTTAYWGHFKVYEFIMERFEDKNPEGKHRYFKSTPLHLAAREGHLEVCRLIIAKLDNPNPAINAKKKESKKFEI